MSLVEKVRGVIADTFGIPLDGIPPEAEYGTVEGWDSMGHIMLIGQLERVFQVTFTIQEIPNLTSIKGITQILTAKGISVQ